MTHRADEVIYLSGPMTGIPEYNHPAFDRAMKNLQLRGRVVKSPHTVQPTIKAHADMIWSDWLKLDLVILLTECNAIAMLDGWERSHGARLELYNAIALGYRIYKYEELEDGSDGKLRTMAMGDK